MESLESPRMISASETLSSRITKESPRPMTVFQRLYADAKNKTRQSTQKAGTPSVQTQSFSSNRIQDVLIEKGRILRQKRDLVCEKWEQQKKELYRDFPLINQRSKEICHLSSTKKFYGDRIHCVNRYKPGFVGRVQQFSSLAGNQSQASFSSQYYLSPYGSPPSYSKKKSLDIAATLAANQQTRIPNRQNQKETLMDALYKKIRHESYYSNASTISERANNQYKEFV